MATLAKRRTVTLVGLEGVKRNKCRSISATSVTDAMRLIRSGEKVTSAGDTGAINVWRDDTGILQCRFMQFRLTTAALSTNSMSAVHRWLKKWWTQLGR
jgi:hypothetical protein